MTDRLIGPKPFIRDSYTPPRESDRGGPDLITALNGDFLGYRGQAAVTPIAKLGHVTLKVHCPASWRL